MVMVDGAMVCDTTEGLIAYQNVFVRNVMLTHSWCCCWWFQQSTPSREVSHECQLTCGRAVASHAPCRMPTCDWNWATMLIDVTSTLYHLRCNALWRDIIETLTLTVNLLYWLHGCNQQFKTKLKKEEWLSMRWISETDSTVGEDSQQSAAVWCHVVVLSL